MNGIDPVTGLPAAGYTRDEELKVRDDDLAKQAEELAALQDVHTADPRAFEPIRELQHEIREHNALAVSKANANFAYCWTYTGVHGQMITLKKTQGWEVVQGNDPEAQEYRCEDTTRRVGDTILMRIRIDRKMLLDEREKQKRLRREQSVSSELETLGHQHADKGFIVHTDQNSTLASGQPMVQVAKTRAARFAGTQNAAMKHVDSMIRRGDVPGLRTPGT